MEKKEDCIVLSKGWYWVEKNSYRWMSDTAEIVVTDNKNYEFLVLKLNSDTPKKCQIYLKKEGQEEEEKFEQILVENETKIRIPFKDLEVIKINSEYFVPSTGDDRRLSFVLCGIELEKNNTIYLFNINQIRTGFEFGHQSTLGMEFSCEEARDKIYENIAFLPHNFDWQDYAFKNGNKRIKTEAEAVEAFLFGKRLNQVGEKTLLISTLFFLPDERSENYLKKLVPELHKQLKDQINLVFIIRDNSFNESKIIKKMVFDLSNQNINIIYSEGKNLGYGKGHNYNFQKTVSDYFLVLNDDLDFLNFEWIKDGIILLENDEKIALKGSDDACKYVDKFGFGKVIGDKSPDYVEGSILLTRSSIFSKLGGFNENIEYFYYEDVDLSLRAKQKGYEIDFLKIEHNHYRSNSAKKLSQETLCSISELNRARFLSRWSCYANSKRSLKNKELILLDSDGFGDLADCYYPATQLIKNNLDKDLSIFISNKKMNFLFEHLNIKIENSKYSLSIRDYDQVYSIRDINFSPPLHTLDLIAAKFGVENFSIDENEIKNLVFNLELSGDIKEILKNYDLKNYCVIHLDSQRKNFEGRQPELKKFIPSLDVLNFNNLILIGDHSIKDYDEVYENYIKNNNKIIDVRKIVTVQDMAILISKSEMFFGIDSGPSHLSQLFNIPSFILYGPIHPLTKIYRYNNSGTYYKNDKNCGLYHRFLEPSYYYDIERTMKCIDIDEHDIANKLKDYVDKGFKFDWTEYFESLRSRQREWTLLQMHNPLFSNKILLKQNYTVKDYVDNLIKKEEK